MHDDKTRVTPRSDGTTRPTSTEPRIVDGQIVFFCPQGHRLVVPLAVAGKHGKCSKCSVSLQIPTVNPAAAAATPNVVAPEAPVAEAPAEPPAPATPATQAASVDEGDWNFISGIDAAAVAEPAFESVGWPDSGARTAGPASVAANPMARLLGRLWAERDHGGIVELHLAGGAVLLPEEFSARWSGGTHGLFASQAADGSLTLTAVAWDTVQRIVVRQLNAVPDDMFD